MEHISHDTIAPVLLSLALILLFAKLGGHLAVRVGQPSVLGELIMGVVLGNVHLLGYNGFNSFKTDSSIDMLAQLGVILLLFEVGLESTVNQMLKVGWPSLVVAVLGVITPFILGMGVSLWLQPEHSMYVHSFIGAALCATSVGITARVLKDLNRSNIPEARIILGAAVIDDVLGLVVLAVVTGVIASSASGVGVSYSAIALICIKAVFFLVGSLWIGTVVSPRLFALASKLKAQGVLLAIGLSFCFLISYAAVLLGLAAIVGAFAAGLILEDVHFRDFTDRGEHTLEELIRPISSFLVPIFFVVMGMRTDLASFTSSGVLMLALALTVAAILGKQACALGVWNRQLDRLSIGIGMIPRGEVGLIFANIGLALKAGDEPVITTTTYSAIIVMVICTTMITPPLLKWSLYRTRTNKSLSPSLPA